MKGFFIKTVNLLLIAGILGGYNGILKVRAQREEIKKLESELYESLQDHTENRQKDQTESTGAYTDGTYLGEGAGFGGKIEVQVTVEGGSITDVTVLSADGEDGAYLDMGQDILPSVIEQQSADVDTISGATFSSGGIRDAAAQAIEKAEQ